MSEDTVYLSQSITNLKQENMRLRRALEELSILNELAREIGASTNSEQIMKKVISRSLRAVHAEQGNITLVKKNSGDPMKTLVRSMVSSSEHKPFHVHQALLGWMHINKKPLALHDPQKDERFLGIQWDCEIKTVLCVPLLVKNELIGILTVCNKKGNDLFSEEDTRLLAIIAGQSAQIVENARLYEQEAKLIRMSEELRLAREIQHGLLPKTIPQISGYDIAGTTLPAQEVGGDYFDFIEIEQNKIAACLGDVAGKGLPASLLMANLQATIRGQALAEASPCQCLQHSNTLLYSSTTSNMFVTFIYGFLKPQEHCFTFANAGHEKPLLFKNNGDVELQTISGVGLGLVQDFEYPEINVHFDPGDTLLVHSDGITEAMDLEDNEFGGERLVTFVNENKNLSAINLINNLVRNVKDFTQSRPQSDDMTILVIKRLPA